jgi:LacI family transcriptional regulator
MSQESTNHVTLSSVAQFAGVSTTTVSRVLNNKGEISDQTRQKVFDAIKALGYRPSLVAQGLRTKASRLIGLMMPEILSPLFTEIAMGVEIEASLAGFTVVQSYTLYSPEREKSGVHYLLDRYVDGVVFYSPVLQEDELIPLLNQIDTSVVINHPVLNPAIGELNVDNLQGMRLAIKHLVEQGCQKIAYFSPSTSSWNGREREAATIKTLPKVRLRGANGQPAVSWIHYQTWMQLSALMICVPSASFASWSVQGKKFRKKSLWSALIIR